MLYMRNLRSPSQTAGILRPVLQVKKLRLKEAEHLAPH